MNKIKIFIIITFIIILIIMGLLVVVNILNKDVQLEKEIEETKTIQEESLNKLTTPLLYYNVNETIKKYMSYEQINNEEAINSILDSSSKDLIKTNMKEENYFYIEEVYAMDRISNMIFYIHTIVNNIDLYFVVNIDYSTYAFEIYDSTQKEYMDAINGKIDEKYKKEIAIKQNEYNKISKDITDISIIQMYYDNFKDLLYYETEKSFDKIDAEYKLEKFNNSLEEYKKYMNDNMDRIMESSIIEYWLEEENNNPMYIFKDTNNNYITIKIKENMVDYSIILDNYTIETETFKEKYSKLTSKEKIEANLGKVFKWIDEKEYNNLYMHLDETFKQNNFPNLQVFINFINNKFFERNIIQTAQISEQGSNYIITVNYSSNTSVAAENRTQAIVMQLKEGTDFVMSFNIE